jgi:tryptophanase
VTPTGGHALYLDAKRWLTHIPQGQYPAWALSLVLYLEGGIRAAEIGSVMFGLQPDGSERPANRELVRLAFPRRVYTQSHVDYVAEVVLHIGTLADRIRGVRIVQSPPVLRHFTSHFAPFGGQLICR